jgi:uncharacterized damage-inducible protein DinB
MQLSQRLLAEFTIEVAATRRVFDRIPEERFSFRPHPKSMSLGQLALHIAQVPGGVTMLVSESPRQAPKFDAPNPEPKSRAELHAALDWSVETVSKALGTWGDTGLEEEWRMMVGETTILALPRFAMVRSTVLNHWYHHRGELMVYLRLLDIPLPSIYGPSADENPFA